MNAPRRPEAVTEPAGAAMETWAEKADEVGAKTLHAAWRVGPYATGCVALLVIAGLLVYYVPPIRSASSETVAVIPPSVAAAQNVTLERLVLIEAEVAKIKEGVAQLRIDSAVQREATMDLKEAVGELRSALLGATPRAPR